MLIVFSPKSGGEKKEEAWTQYYAIMAIELRLSNQIEFQVGVVMDIILHLIS